MATVPLRLIVGLGNPGSEYQHTRHNVGAWLVSHLAEQYGTNLRSQQKFQGQFAEIKINNQLCWLLIPTTFMNHSGRSVSAVAHFYKINPEEILVAHDELDFPAGTVRLKEGGGHGGHNGLRDIINHLGADFKRLRIGIGHPGEKSQVVDYVLKPPTLAEKHKLLAAIEQAIDVVPELQRGDFQQAFRYLHEEE